MHGITYDPVHDEFTVPQQFGQAILTYRGAANGEERPIRIIQGPHTQLDAPEHLDVDVTTTRFSFRRARAAFWSFRAMGGAMSRPSVFFKARTRCSEAMNRWLWIR